MECVHLVVEDLGLAALRGGDEVTVKALEDVLADLGKLGLDLLTVLLDESDLDSSFCSIEVTILHEARRAPMTFL
jgi:hypothetical protein